MKRLSCCIVFLIILTLLLSGCFNKKNQCGSLHFRMDFTSLLEKSTVRTIPTITGVQITLSREGYDSVIQNLTVDNNIATGTITGLASGYWHIEAIVCQNETTLFTGSEDVNVIAGVTVQCTLLFEPGDPDVPTTGSISFVIGLNPLPGYRLVAETANKILVDSGNSLIYILDSPSKKIGVYNAENLYKTKDLLLPEAPSTMALNYDNTGILLGYESGSIYLLDLVTENFTLVGDALIPICHMVAFSPKFVLVTDDGYYDSTFKTVDITTHQIIESSCEYYDQARSLEFNPQNCTVYFHDKGVSPADLNRVRLDATDGSIIDIGESIYHGDYTLGYPIRIINNGTRVITSYGSMFSCSTVDADDLIYSGNLGKRYIDLACDDANGYLYAIGNDTIIKLLIIDQNTYFVKSTIDLDGTPKYVFNTVNNIIVFSQHEGRYYMKSLEKSDLGLTN